jgi:hypothetical protein
VSRPLAEYAGRRHTGRRVREHRAANAACTTVETSHNASTPTSCATLDTTGRSSPGSSAFALRRRSGPRFPRTGRSSSPHSTPRPRRRPVAPPHGSWPGRRRSAGGRSAAARRGVAQPRLRLDSHHGCAEPRDGDAWVEGAHQHKQGLILHHPLQSN